MDLYFAILPILVMSKLFGTVPFVQDGRFLKFGLGAAIYVAFFILLITGLWLYLTFPSLLKPVNMFGAVAIFETSTITFINVAHRLICLVNYNKILKLFSRVIEIDGYMVELRQTYKYMFRISLITILASLVLLLVCVLGLHMVLVPHISFEVILRNMKSVILRYSFLLIDIQYISLILVLHQMFKYLNKRIKDKVIKCAKNSLQSYRPIEMSFGVHNTVSFKTIHEWSAIHNKMCNVCEMINSDYWIQNLVNTATALVTVTFSLYFCLYRLVQEEKVIQNRSISWDILTFYWGTLSSMAVFLKILSCHKTSKEANRTAVLVHKLLNRTTDPILEEELYLFSLQLLHRKVVFTAGDIFPINFTLLYSIVGTVTTYLVILIQFQLTFKDDVELTPEVFYLNNSSYIRSST